MRHEVSSNPGCHMQIVRLQRHNQRPFQIHDVSSIRPPRCSRKTPAPPSCQKHLHPAPLLPQLMLLTLPVDTLEASHLLRSHPKASVHRARAPCTPRYGPYRSPVMDPGIGAGAPHPLFTSISRHLGATFELFSPMLQDYGLFVRVRTSHGRWLAVSQVREVCQFRASCRAAFASL